MEGTTGNVGIGPSAITGPQARLHVDGGAIAVTNSGTPPGGGVGLGFGSITGNYRWIQSHDGQPLSINPLGNNVGIGTTTPSTELHVAQDNSLTGGGQLIVSGRTNQNKQTVIGFNVTGNYGQIQAVEQSVAVRPLALNPAGGNVGIGITTPAALLHVAGDALVNTNLTVNGNTQLGDATSDNVTFTARVNSHIHPSTDATYDLGSSTLRWKDGWFSGTVTSQNATVTSLTPGSVVFAGTGGALSQNNANFFWDNTGSQLGLGTNSPGARLDVRPTASQLGVRIRAASSSTTNPLRIEDNSGQYRWRIDQNFDMYVTNSSGTDIGVWKNSGDVGIGTNAPATRLHLNNSSSAAVTERFTNTAVTTGFDVGITSTGTAELRHRNDFPIEVYVNNTRALRIEPTSSTTNQVPNIIGGDATNDVDNGYEGGFIGGGSGHFIGNDFAVIAGGQNNTVNGSTSAIVAGSANEVNSSNSFIGAGSENVVGGDFSAIVSGTNNGASGNYSFVGSGDFNFASGNYAGILGGEDNVASGNGSMAVGAGLRAESYREVVVGSYNTQATSPNATTWVATDRLFVVGNGQSDATRSDALIIWKNGAAQFFGNVTLGDATSDNVTFTARVSSHIHPSTGATYDLGASTLRWKDGWFSGTVTSQNATVTSLTPGSVVFAGTGGVLSQNNANFFWDNTNVRLGIGTNTPSANLHVIGNATITSNTSVGGNLNVSGGATIGAGLTVSSGGATITGNTSTSGNLFAGGNLSVNGNTTLGSAAANQVTINAATVAVPNIPSSSTATQVVVWNSNNLERRAASGLISTYAWMLGGNAITNPATEWLGTTTTQPLVFRTNSTQILQLNTNGSIQRDGSGSTRGTNANDFQMSRSVTTQVASGSAATIAGGVNNTASGVQSFIGAGDGNTASNTNAAVVAGTNNVASGAQSAILGGENNQAIGQHSVVSGGQGNVAAGPYSAIAGGFNLRVGNRSFGFSGQTSGSLTDLSGNSNIAAFADVDLWLYAVRNQASQLRFYERSGAGGNNYTAFQAQDQSSDIVYTLPAAITAGGVLQTDASGNLSWVAPSAYGWQLNGNSITSAWNGTTGSFLGTTNTQPLVIATTNTSTPQPIQLWTNNAERMRITESGIVRIQNQATGGTTEFHVRPGNGNKTQMILQFGSNQIGTDLLQWQNEIGTVIGRIDAAGNLAIGTSVAAAFLHVVANSPSPAARFEGASGGPALMVGTNGDGISEILHNTISVNPPNIGGNSSATLTVTITGVNTGDRVFLTPPSDLEDELVFQGATVTGANTVTIKIRNVSGGAVDGSARNWNYLVIKP
ncbi:MAG: hypothetical protein N3B17_04975 [Chlorobi bacterium]|nr:hypothetical protein [Chlorobiota bacterium]